MAEWFMALVLKTSDTERYRGFESLSLRHLNCIGQAVQKYPRGRRGSPAKGVGCVKRREGSNPSFCARKRDFDLSESLLFCPKVKEKRDLNWPGSERQPSGLSEPG